MPTVILFALRFRVLGRFLFILVRVECDQGSEHRFVCARGGEGGGGQGCIRREGTSEVASEAVGQAVGGGCQSGWGRLLSVTNAIEAGTCRQRDGGWA